MDKRLLFRLEQSQSRLQPGNVQYELCLDEGAIEAAFRRANGRCCAWKREMWGARRVVSWARRGVWNVVE
jgi:hypothetical protein